MGQEEAERKLQMECGASILDRPAQEKGECCQKEAQQREAQSHIGDHSQHTVLLQAIRECMYIVVSNFTLELSGTKSQ